MKEYTVSEAIATGFTHAYLYNKQVPLSEIDPDNVETIHPVHQRIERPYVLRKTTVQDVVLEPESLFNNYSELHDPFDDYLDSIPYDVLRQAVDIINNWTKDNPWKRTRVVGCLVNRRL